MAESVVPGRYDITVVQGANFYTEATWLGDDEVTPVDLTGYTVEAQVRSDTAAPDVLLTFVGALVDAEAGVVSWSATPAVTAALSPWRKAVWDLKLTPASGDDTVVLLQGSARFDAAVTR